MFNQEELEEIRQCIEHVMYEESDVVAMATQQDILTKIKKWNEDRRTCRHHKSLRCLNCA